MSDALAAGDVALLEAARADVHLLRVAVLEDGDALDVGLELAVHGAVGVADGTTSNGVLAADITYLRHNSDLHGRRSGGARRRQLTKA